MSEPKTPRELAVDFWDTCAQHDGTLAKAYIDETIRRRDEQIRQQGRARVAVGRRAWARVHEALGIKPDGLAGILGAIEDLKERVERGEHRQDTPARVVDVPGCMCVPYQLSVCEACEKHFDLERGEHRK